MWLLRICSYGICVTFSLVRKFGHPSVRAKTLNICLSKLLMNNLISYVYDIHNLVEIVHFSSMQRLAYSKITITPTTYRIDCEFLT